MMSAEADSTLATIISTTMYSCTILRVSFVICSLIVSLARFLWRGLAAWDRLFAWGAWIGFGVMFLFYFLYDVCVSFRNFIDVMGWVLGFLLIIFLFSLSILKFYLKVRRLPSYP